MSAGTSSGSARAVERLDDFLGGVIGGVGESVFAAARGGDFEDMVEEWEGVGTGWDGWD